MKTLRIFLLPIATFVFSHSSAQIQQGSWRVGGGASYTHASFESDNSYSSVSLSPSVSYFPIDHLSIGLAFPFSASKGKTGTGEYSNSRYSVGPQVRYYFPFGKWAFFPEVIYSFGKTVSENSGFSTGDPVLYKTETTFSAFRAGAGITYFLNDNVGVEGIIFYQNNEQEVINPFAVVSYEKSINLSLGFQIYLNRK
ncbi:MAG TPA: outer membrane beta-barrel protein [Chryseosolibacter sp.]